MTGNSMWAKLSVLIVTAFVDMVGLLMVIPLMPYYARDLGANALMVAMLVSSFTFAAQAAECATLGTGVRPVWTPSRVVDWARSGGDRVCRLRVCDVHLVAPPIARGARGRRRDDGGGAGVRRGLRRAEGASQGVGMALRGDECRRGARTTDRVVRAPAVPSAWTGDDRGDLVRGQYAVRVALSDRIAGHGRGQASRAEAWRVVGGDYLRLDTYHRASAPVDLDVRNRDGGVSGDDDDPRTLPGRQVWRRVEGHLDGVHLHRDYLRHHASGHPRVGRRPLWGSGVVARRARASGAGTRGVSASAELSYPGDRDRAGAARDGVHVSVCDVVALAGDQE